MSESSPAPKLETEHAHDSWFAAGELLAPIISQTLATVEKLTKPLKKCEVWMLERDMLPLFIANQFKNEISCPTKLIPGSSSVLGRGVRNAVDSVISALNHGWISNSEVENEIQEIVDILIIDPDTNKQLAAYCRSIYTNLGIQNHFTDEEIFKQLKGEAPVPPLKREVSNILFFDTLQIGTYIEITAAIIKRIYPHIKCRGILLESRNSRIPYLIPKIDDMHVGSSAIEDIPKPYELVAPVDGYIRTKLRDGKIAEYWIEFCLGLKKGLRIASSASKNIQTKKILVKYEHIEPNLWAEPHLVDTRNDVIIHPWDLIAQPKLLDPLF